MKLAVLGATGGIGMEVVRQAIAQDHQVTAFVRSPERLEEFGGRITVIAGDPLDPDQLARAISGHDAILSGFGPRQPSSNGDGDLLARFAGSLTQAMLRDGVRRAVIVSTAFLFKDSIMPPTNLVGRLFFAHIVADATRMEETLLKSGLDLTVVRPPRLTDKPRTSRYRVREGHLPGFGFTISRADVAEFMLKTAVKSAFIGKVVGVSN